MTKLIIIGLGLGVVISLLMILVLEVHRRKHYQPKNVLLVDDGIRHKDIEFRNANSGTVVLYAQEDGPPGGPRGRVWSDKERAEHRRDRERRKLRVIG